MKTNPIEILLYLVENVLDGKYELPPEPKHLINELQAAGFSQEQIEDAFNWFASLLKNQSIKSTTKSLQTQGIRVFNTDEQDRLSLANRGLLLSLEQIGLINPNMREEIINRAMMIDIPEIQDDHFHWLVLSVIHQQEQFGSPATTLWLQDFNRQPKRELQ